MPAKTGEKEIDHKLYEIFKATRPNLRDPEALAKAVKGVKPLAFTYVRDGTDEVAGEKTIERYIKFAQEISLLDDKCYPTVKKNKVRSLLSFQNWLKDHTQIYLDKSNCSADRIGEVAGRLLAGAVPKLPTDKNVHEALAAPIELGHFRYAVRIISIFKAEKYTVRSHPVFIIDDVVTE